MSERTYNHIEICILHNEEMIRKYATCLEVKLMLDIAKKVKLRYRFSATRLSLKGSQQCNMIKDTRLSIRMAIVP